MIAPLVIFPMSPAPAVASVDLLFVGALDFSTTSVEVKAETEKGRAFMEEIFGFAVVSVRLPKSKADDFSLFASDRGIGWDAR